MEAKLVIQEGKFQGYEIPIPNTVLVIGRNTDCHVRLHSPTVSKRHCAIAAWAGKVRVRDLQSRNGTYLNGKPVVGEALVCNGDRLQIANHTFYFRIRVDQDSPYVKPVEAKSLAWLLRTSGEGWENSHETHLLGPDLRHDPSHDHNNVTVSAGRLLREFVAKQESVGRH
jgi:pSer/pThr/pTyr-binding forkhead associated (FHA) protein